MTRRLVLAVTATVAFIAFLPASAVSLPKPPGRQCSDAHLQLLKRERPLSFAACAAKIDKAILAGNEGKVGDVKIQCIGGVAQCCELKNPSWACTAITEAAPGVAPGVPGATSAPLVPSPGATPPGGPSAPLTPPLPGTGK